MDPICQISFSMSYQYKNRHVNKKEKKSENWLCALPRLAKPAEHVSWGFLSELNVNPKYLVLLVYSSFLVFMYGHAPSPPWP